MAGRLDRGRIVYDFRTRPRDRDDSCPWCGLKPGLVLVREPTSVRMLGVYGCRFKACASGGGVRLMEAGIADGFFTVERA